jgi:osmoprotectant transport system substrate-binding protein
MIGQPRGKIMINQRSILILMLLLTIVFTAAQPAQACVGRKLVLGVPEGEEAGMVSRILSILIHERTGTTVEVKFFPSARELETAVGRSKVDLYVDYVDEALDKKGLDSSGSAAERYARIKQLFDEEHNLVWLKPMGFSGGKRGQAATVVRKDALKKFPALPRLLEKIGTRVMLDNDTLKKLVTRGRDKKPAKVARQYLKEVKLI